MLTNDYLRQSDLNPTIGAVAVPVQNPLDPRALFMFGFSATEQTITNTSGYPVFVSFDFQYDTGIPIAPFPPSPRVHLTLGPGQSRTLPAHARGHAIVWLDITTGLPPMGAAVVVQVEARS